MLDLTSGTLELDGTAFGPRTTLDQLRNSGLPIRAAGAPSAGITLVRGSGLVHVDGAPFLPEFYFSGSLPSRVLLRPAVQYPPSMTDPAERQRLRYVACARWLFVRLGKPHYERPGEVRYDFPWGTVSAVAHLLPRDGCDAGYLAVRYGGGG